MKYAVYTAILYLVLVAFNFLSVVLDPGAMDILRRSLLAVPLLNIYLLTKTVPQLLAELSAFFVLNFKYDQAVEFDRAVELAAETVFHSGSFAIFLLVALS